MENLDYFSDLILYGCGPNIWRHSKKKHKTDPVSGKTWEKLLNDYVYDRKQPTLEVLYFIAKPLEVDVKDLLRSTKEN